MRTPKLSYRENFLKTASFDYPEYIPCRISISWPVWNIHRDKLKGIVKGYPLFFPSYGLDSINYNKEPRVIRYSETKVDPFGCVWYFSIKGLKRIVVKHPLDDWNKLKEYEFEFPKDSNLNLKIVEFILTLGDKSKRSKLN
mgnify:CR=1 FL=1